jgi:FADH2 O2-dependent halogenase
MHAMIRQDLPLRGVFDVAILGSGIAGSMMAAILARHGKKVLMVDQGEHPRFALGESTVPHTSMMMRILGDRYDVPEIKHCADFRSIHAHVTRSCGIKRNFGFVYHREGRPQDPREATQSVIAEYPHGPESHLFRQDVDAYLHNAAIRYGAVSRQKTAVDGIEVDGSGVRLQTRSGEEYKTRFLIDAAGFRSPLAQRFGLRETPTRLQTHSRSVFTHMIGVRPYDDCVEPKGAHGMPRLWCQGTLHHLFDGGWMWIIPFDNHEKAMNPLCSVGLNLDSRRFPKNGQAPEQEFSDFLARYPDMAAQLESAVAVRDWVSTERLQYSATRNVGERFLLMSHASGAIDALFSRGLANTAEIVNAAAAPLLRALDDDDFSVDRFEYVDRLQQAQLDYNDKLVNSSYVSFVDFDLWNAWYRIWVIGAFYGWLRLNRFYKQWEDTGDVSWLERLEKPRWYGSLCPDVEAYENLFVATTGIVEEVEAGASTPARAAGKIMDLLREATFVPPMFEIDDPERRHTVDLDYGTYMKLLGWFRRSAPAEVRKLMFAA